MHFAVSSNLNFTDDGDVVLGLTCRDTGITAGARIQVDRHRPLFTLVNIDFVGIHVVVADLFRFRFPLFNIFGRILIEIVQIVFDDNFTVVSSKLLNVIAINWAVALSRCECC